MQLRAVGQAPSLGRRVPGSPVASAAASRHADDLNARAAQEFAGDAVACGAWPGGVLAKPGPSLH